MLKMIKARMLWGVLGLGMAGIATAQEGVLLGPFVENTGSWMPVFNGGFNTDLNGWGGNGASSFFRPFWNGTVPEPSTLPMASNPGVMSYYGQANIPDSGTVWGGWISGGPPPITPGQDYVISMFVRVNGRPMLSRESFWVAARHTITDWVATPPPIGSFNGWQFVYKRFTAGGFWQGSSFFLLAFNFLWMDVNTRVDFDEISLTPAAQFQLPVPAPAVRTTFSGNVSLGGWSGARDLYCDFTLEPIGGGPAVQVNGVRVQPNGQYTFTVSSGAGYRVFARTATSLRKRYLGDFALNGANYGGVNFTLVNGDCNGDNEVGAADFSLLASKYDSLEGEWNWDPRPDLNGDGEVGAADFSILAGSYDEVGE